MTIAVLSEQINALSEPSLDNVFSGDVMIRQKFMNIIKRASDIFKLRDLYLQRAILHQKSGTFENASLDYFHSARLGHPASKAVFSKFSIENIQYLHSTVEIPDKLTADNAFIAFLQHSIGIDKSINHVKALFNLKCAAQLGHHYAQALCKEETIKMITQCMLTAKISETILVHFTLDNANSITGKYLLFKNFRGQAMPCFENASKLGSGHGFMGLATLYFDNISFSKDYLKSFRLYAIAAQLGISYTLRDDAFQAITQIAHTQPEETIIMLDDLAESRLISFPDFYKGLNGLIQRKRFGFWSDRPDFDAKLMNKIHEILALCEITQNPCSPEAGLKHMSNINDFSSCSQSICEKLTSFHRNFPGRITLTAEFCDLLSPFAHVANGEPSKESQHNTHTMQSMV